MSYESNTVPGDTRGRASAPLLYVIPAATLATTATASGSDGSMRDALPVLVATGRLGPGAVATA